jgi:perosamine synthetase
MKTIPVAEPDITRREWQLVKECLSTGWISSIGKFVARFEDEFSQFCGVKYGIATSNGTTALHLALATMGIGKGDEVLVPALTFVATANAVTYTGAKPVFVDSDPQTWNMDPQDALRKITRKTRAIIPVHLYGHPADLDSFTNIAQKKNLYLIEDAAQAHGAEYKGRKAGSFGDMGCFSFYGNKIITTGEGGMIITNNKKLASKARFLRDQAMDSKKRYWHREVGFNYRMTNIQAAIGVGQLERIDKLIDSKRNIAYLYNRNLKNTEGITLPPELAWVKNVYWMYSILIEPCIMKRDALMMELSKNGIDTRPFFCPVNILPMYRKSNPCPVAERIAERGLNLPSSSKLSAEEINFISRKVKEIVAKK